MCGLVCGIYNVDSGSPALPYESRREPGMTRQGIINMKCHPELDSGSMLLGNLKM